jgi:hypothetical protein
MKISIINHYINYFFTEIEYVQSPNIPPVLAAFFSYALASLYAIALELLIPTSFFFILLSSSLFKSK